MILGFIIGKFKYYAANIPILKIKCKRLRIFQRYGEVNYLINLEMQQDFGF